MRNTFVNKLVALAAERENVFLVTADLGFSVLENFAEKFPERYINVGVAEQNMTGIAAGLAHLGHVVFTYSIANFPTLRCFEQIRNDVCYHQLPVRIVAVGGGMTYGAQGYTHHGIEDLGVMRTLPQMAVFAPGDPVEVELITEALIDYPHPAYLRLGKSGEKRLHEKRPAFQIGKSILMRSGSDITLVSTGGMLGYTLETAEELARHSGISARVLSMPTVKPLDVEAVCIAARETGGVVTVEEHNVGSGLGVAVADALLSNGVAPKVFYKFGLPDKLCTAIGSHSYMLKLAGDLREDVLRILQIA